MVVFPPKFVVFCSRASTWGCFGIKCEYREQDDVGLLVHTNHPST
jgi:hypothetical protein